MLLLSKKDIKEVFTMRDAIEANKEAFKIYTEGKSTVPLRTTIPATKQEGTMLFMPGYIENLDCAAVKIVSVFPRNEEKGKPVTPATVLLLDGTTGEVCSILDGTYVTQLRTGAASGAALDILAIKNAKKGALIGTGGQASAQLEAMIESRNLEEVYIYDIDIEKTKKFVSQMNQELSNYNTKFNVAKTSDEAIENADVIITVTTAKKPVFDGNKVKKGATISAVGSYLPTMQELDPAVLTRASKIFFESTDAVLAESGDILTPLADGIISNDDFNGELGQVINNEIAGRENDEEIIVFKTVGIAVQDVVTAKKIYDNALKRNIGINW
ncbi:ornithine cyclodeaminase family protein [Romboutsia sp.]|uniref:ornithine cyclodeaminase family protein n=1 Tax=Romboutsia sp. TaxID=1965302 RepID=UPI002C3F7D87|nr:ornithine cyclodeaminase family protein [Romboutsia sp.]HSQ89910.1 ornithine cyclodeaminase family protein [Romboutsia sp.]